MSEKSEIQSQIAELESQMNDPNFWADKNKAQGVIKQIQELRDQLEGVGKYDRGPAVMSILAGAGGDDAEDFARILIEMYQKFFESRGWVSSLMHANQNDQGGYRNITIEIDGKNVYGTLKGENGVHRLVRLSPFNANQKRHTSFVMVEVTPVLDQVDDFEINPDDIEIEFSRSSGPGGQNVNKRETAVRITHTPSGITVRADGQRTQEANRDKAMQMLHGKIATALEEARKQDKDAMKISATTKIEWGNQIRSYVLHPYQMIKDHRTDVEVRDVDRVLQRGELDDLLLKSDN